MYSKLPTLDEFHYHHRLRQTRGKSLVLFGSPGCGACRVAQRRLPEVAAADIRLFRVDVQMSPGLARALDVFHLPTLILYLDGHYHARLDCELTREALVAAVARALDRPAEEEP